MNKNILIDPLSGVPIHVECGLNGEKIGDGTGFVVLQNETYYLITNWHVLTLRRIYDNEPLRPDKKADPNMVNMKITSIDHVHGDPCNFNFNQADSDYLMVTIQNNGQKAVDFSQMQNDIRLCDDNIMILNSGGFSCGGEIGRMTANYDLDSICRINDGMVMIDSHGIVNQIKPNETQRLYMGVVGSNERQNTSFLCGHTFDIDLVGKNWDDYGGTDHKGDWTWYYVVDKKSIVISC